MLLLLLGFLWVYMGLIFAAEILRYELENFGLIVDDTVNAALLFFFLWPFVIAIGMTILSVEERKRLDF